MFNYYDWQRRPYTYIAADWDGDSNAVEVLNRCNNDARKLLFKSAHDLMQSRDSSLNCSIKLSLNARLNESFRFILIVGKKTISVRSGSCHLCKSYNSHNRYCTREYSLDYRSYIDFECDKAVSDGLQIVVLYNSHTVDSSLCPESVRDKGTHREMWSWGGNQWVWDCYKIAAAIG
jgi:hypothetical protein